MGRSQSQVYSMSRTTTKKNEKINLLLHMITGVHKNLLVVLLCTVTNSGNKITVTYEIEDGDHDLYQ